MKIYSSSRLKTIKLGAGEAKVIDKADSAVSKIDLSWLALAAPVYHISPNIDDYVIVNTIITISDLPNRNGIAFPLTELVGFDEPPYNRLAYEGWLKAPLFAEHDNADCTKAKGVVLDVSLRKVEGYGQGRLWKVTGILAFDKTKDPELAEKIANGTINTYSMGATADHFTCSYCGEVCTESHCCAHIKSIDTVNFSEVKDVDGNTHLAFLNAHGLSPIEVSAVEDPAWAPALSTNILFNKAPNYKVTLDKQDSKKSNDNDRPSANEIIEHLSRISFNNGY